MSAHDLRFPDLIWSHFSRPPLGGFDERVAAAADAGMVGIGLYVAEYERLRHEEGRSAADIRAVLEAHGVVLAEIEVVTGWWATDGPNAQRCAHAEALAYEMADELGARYLQAIGPYEGPPEQAIEGFGALCDRAAAHDLLVGIEWLPFTNIATAADAQAIVDAADRPNGGYCIDLWHHVRGADAPGALRALDPAKVFAIQMNDGPAAPTTDDYKADCLANRVPPGEGMFDCAAFVRTLRESGIDAPLSLEVCSDRLWAAPAADAARASADGMRRVLQAVGAG